MLYKAFISYSHQADTRLAPVLQSALRSFAKPWYRLRSMRVFRDTTNLAANPALWDSIQNALAESEYFLLLASPQAAQSFWVEREIKWWLDNRSIEKMLIIVTDGELVWDRITNDYDWEHTTALPDNLRGQFEDEPLHVDLSWAKSEEKLSLRHSQFRSAVLDIVAPLYGKVKDELDGEDVRQLRKNKRWAWLAVIALLITTASALVGAVIAVNQKNIAKENEQKAISRQLASQAELLGRQQANLLPQSVLLATESLKRYSTFSADQALYHGLSLLGPKPLTQKSYQGLADLVLSPHGKYLAQRPYDGPVVIEETVSGKVIANLINVSFNNEPLPRLSSVSFSGDEKRVATVGAVGVSAFVWELPGGREIFRTPVDRMAIMNAVLSDDGEVLATGHADGILSLWNISTGRELSRSVHADPQIKMVFSPDGKYLVTSSSQDLDYGPISTSIFKLWDVLNGREIAILQHVGPVTKVAFSANGKFVATTSKEQAGKGVYVSIWDTETGKEVTQVEHEMSVNAISFTPNNRFLLTGSSDNTARLWDVNSGEELLRIDHGNSVSLVDGLMAGDSSYMITAGGDGVLRLWGFHFPTQEYLRLMESPNVLAYAEDINARYMVTISHDLYIDLETPPDQYQRDVRVWSIDSIEENLRLKHENAVGRVKFSPDSRYLVTFDFQLPTFKEIPKTAVNDSRVDFTDLGSGNVYVWDVSTRKRRMHLEHPGTVMEMDYDSTGAYLVTGCVDGGARVWEIADGKEIINLQHNGWIYSVAFSPHGRYVATISGTPEMLGGQAGIGMTTIWDWQTGREVGHLQTDKAKTSVAFSPDGKYLAVGGHDGIVHVLDATNAHVVKELQQEDPIKKNEIIYNLVQITFSSDGHSIAAATGRVSKDSVLTIGETTLWNIDSGKKIVSKKHEGQVERVAFSRNGEFLVSIDQKGMVNVWATTDGSEIRTMKHEERITKATIDFSPDDKYLLIAFDNKAKILEVATGKEIARREHPSGELLDAIFSPNSKYLATASTDATAGLWLWRPDDLIEEACNRLSRNLTQEEWRQFMGDEIAYEVICVNPAN
ncbi:toll/interleukin-1 receptor domain-containing protein [Desulfosediminicola flagellatus]|uniref:toll/interleukin-1 receptor domain-containing protein n=1 Tax=Desulfosediminicola flagellatus TaxID=2569541 RepID=UPI0010AB905C|nr:cytochrome D1 domain-containing protein [Desulfosediminicola flagellatus]